jgi:pilus assembly protein CpaF
VKFLDRALKIQNEIQNSPFENIGFQSLETKQAGSVRISEIIKQTADQIDEATQARISHEFQGFGPLENLIADPEVTEIILNSREHIWFEKNGHLKKLEDSFISDLTFDNFMHRLCVSAHVQTSKEMPFANGRIGDFRLHIASAEITESSPALTLRRIKPQAFSFEDLLADSWTEEKNIKILRQWISHHKNFIVIGETGSGKTSLLSTCLREISPAERAVIIEDTNELISPNQASVKMLTRQQNPHLPSIDLTELVKQSLRMRPDRLIVGEVRSGEAKDLILALSTGHRGCMGTLHASSPHQALIRLEMLIQLGAPNWSLQAIRRLIGLSLDGIVCVGKNKEGKRKLKSIHQITSVEETGILLDCLVQENF